MRITTINKHKSILVPLSSTTFGNIISIEAFEYAQLGQEIIPNHTVISSSIFVKNLRAYAKIESLPESPLPDFKNTDSDTERLRKILAIEWQSPRKQLNLYMGRGLLNFTGQPDWHPIGSLSLLHAYGYPYRLYNLMDLFTDALAIELSPDDKIGIQQYDVNYGFLEEEDKVTIHGSYVQEIIVQSPEIIPIVNVYGVGGTAQPPPQPPPQTGGSDIDNNSYIDNEFLIKN